MRYFIVQTQPSFDGRVEITGWKDKINRKWLNPEQLYRIPDKIVLSVTTGEYLPLPDFIVTPFLLGACSVHHVIRLYGDTVYTRNVILIDHERNMVKQYYLLVPERLEEGGAPLRERNFFWMDAGGERKTVVSLAFAESILRRGVTGISLEETEVTEKGGSGNVRS